MSTLRAKPKGNWRRVAPRVGQRGQSPMIVDNISWYFSHALCCCHNRNPRELIIYHRLYSNLSIISARICLCMLGIQIQPLRICLFFCKLATIKGRGDDVNYGLRWIEYCNKAVKIKMVVLMPMNMEQQVCVALLSQGPHTFITETSWDCSTTAFIAIHCNFCFCSSRRREHFWETDIEDDEEKHPPICEKWGLNVKKMFL